MNFEHFLAWTNEVSYIRHVARHPDGFAEFNFDTECFKRYAAMQADDAPPVFAAQIREILSTI